MYICNNSNNNDNNNSNSNSNNNIIIIIIISIIIYIYIYMCIYIYIYTQDVRLHGDAARGPRDLLIDDPVHGEAYADPHGELQEHRDIVQDGLLERRGQHELREVGDAMAEHADEAERLRRRLQGEEVAQRVRPRDLFFVPPTPNLPTKIR